MPLQPLENRAIAAEVNFNAAVSAIETTGTSDAIRKAATEERYALVYALALASKGKEMGDMLGRLSDLCCRYRSALESLLTAGNLNGDTEMVKKNLARLEGHIKKLGEYHRPAGEDEQEQETL